jgi:hypothetical protein
MLAPGVGSNGSSVKLQERFSEAITAAQVQNP